MRQHYIQNIGIQPGYLDWECMDVDVHREEFMFQNFAASNQEMMMSLHANRDINADKATANNPEEAEGDDGISAGKREFRSTTPPKTVVPASSVQQVLEAAATSTAFRSARGETTTAGAAATDGATSQKSSTLPVSLEKTFLLPPQQDVFFVRNQLSFLLREVAGGVLKNGVLVRTAGEAGAAVDAVDEENTSSVFKLSLLSTSSLYDAVQTVTEPPRSLWNIWKDFTHISPEQVPHRGLEWGKRMFDLKNEKNVRKNYNKLPKSGGEQLQVSILTSLVAEQQKTEGMLVRKEAGGEEQRATQRVESSRDEHQEVAAQSATRTRSELQHEAEQNQPKACYFIHAYVMFQMFQNLEATADVGLNALAMFHLGENYLTEQLLFTKTTAHLLSLKHAKNDQDLQAGEETETESKSVFQSRPNALVVELRKGVAVTLHSSPSTSDSEDDSEDSAAAVGSPLLHLEAVGDTSVLAPLEDILSDGTRTRKAATSASRSLRLRGFPLPDILRKLLYTSININGILAQLSQCRRVWVSDGGRKEPGYSKPSNHLVQQARPPRYFRMQVFPHRELASSYIRYKKEPFCNMDPFREILQTVSADEPLRISEGGAHLGDCALLAASLLPTARITAIEPLPDASFLLQNSVLLNERLDFPNRLHVVKAALDDGTVRKLQLTHLPGRSASASANDGNYVWNCNKNTPEHLCRRHDVEVLKLDEVIDFAHVVKLSIQGNEIAALRGSSELMQRFDVCSWFFYFGKVNLGTRVVVKVDTTTSGNYSQLTTSAESLKADGNAAEKEDGLAEERQKRLNLTVHYPFPTWFMSSRSDVELHQESSTNFEEAPAKESFVQLRDCATTAQNVKNKAENPENTSQENASYARCVSVTASEELWRLLATMDLYYVNYAKKLVTARRIENAFDLHLTMQANLNLLDVDEDAFWKEYLIATQKTGLNKRCVKFVTHVWRQFRLM
ncbi:unnamed protein product [Amoebophrya sp. A120]|nr:unnamed protein product [Amoebophrya sp. A120]|eukprot:GSA120T00003894001.1